jgi:peptide methionine sulfoxide reductase msrA/msrB
MYGARITDEEKSTLGTYIALGVVTALAAGAVYLFVLAHQEKVATTGFDPKRPVPSDDVLQRRLKPEEFAVVRQGFTQMPFQNEFWNNERPGIYVDVITGEPLFSSRDKFDAGLGMPTFSKPISPDLIVTQLDTSHDMQRTEVRARRSNAHLGHVFPDPNSPTGQRYVVNSAAFHFIPQEQMEQEGYKNYLPLLEQK